MEDMTGDSRPIRHQLIGMFILSNAMLVFDYGCAPSVLPYESLVNTRQQPLNYAVHYPTPAFYGIY